MSTTLTPQTPTPDTSLEDLQECIKVIKEDSHNYKLSGPAENFLTIVGNCASIIPVIGPVINLGTQIISLPFVFNDLKLELSSFNIQLLEYSEAIAIFIATLNDAELEKIDNITLDDVEQINRSAKIVVMTITEIDYYLKKVFEYSNKDYLSRKKKSSYLKTFTTTWISIYQFLK
jgi:hypothetical protein